MKNIRRRTILFCGRLNEISLLVHSCGENCDFCVFMNSYMLIHLGGNAFTEHENKNLTRELVAECKTLNCYLSWQQNWIIFQHIYKLGRL